MSTLEDLKRDATVKGILPNALVTVVDAKWHGDAAVELTYRDDRGEVGNELLYRTDEDRLEIVTRERPWQFDGDGELLRLVSEANRIRLAHLFDPLLAVHTSLIDPLPHQITGVYGEMLPRQPLRFLLADDPGAGKTIMAGLLIKELRARGDVQRCLICAPGNLVEQWQDEMQLKFGLPFEIITRERIEASLTGNPFAEIELVIGRLDQMARSEEIRAKLEQTEWDLIVCDEAHKMSAHYFGQKIEETRRYQLGRLLVGLTRHVLLMTATPHSGKHEDFQLFMRLIDPDRFEGRPRGAGDIPDSSDLMRRMVKENLAKFDGTPLFPERRPYTIDYELSGPEQDLYDEVTAYVTEEMNRADRLRDAGQGRRGNNVGFALTILQRRLASSPEAIFRSLQRRRERLEAEMADLQARGQRLTAPLEIDVSTLPEFTEEDDMDEFYERPEDEVAAEEEEVLDRATAAMTIQELRQEIESLKRLETRAKRVRNAGTDKKWEELSSILQREDEMFDAKGGRRKLIIFTEHRDTLNYLTQRIRTLLGRPDAVTVIHGGLRREDRRKAQEGFIHNPDVHILVATDAAGEGVNLQRAHLMVNYDLPWNPNRIEQRFGRIHRIGQTEVCHLWNLVAGGTREGAVYQRLLQKLESESDALGGKVFDVLGKMFQDKPLRDLLVEAIRYGEDPQVKARLFQQVETPFDPENVKRLFQEHALAADTMDASELQQVREDMERAEARKLQPHFIKEFFEAAFKTLGGRMVQREAGRYEITRVPAVIRNAPRKIGRGAPVLEKYERVCFEKHLVTVEGKPPATLICPGHPLLDAIIEVTLERNRDLLRRGAVLVDTSDDGRESRVLFYLEHAIADGRENRDGTRHVASRRMEFVEIDAHGSAVGSGYAPYLDYEPLEPDDRPLVADLLEEEWLTTDLEAMATSYAIEHIVPQHMAEVRARVEEQVDKTLAAVQQRLTTEIAYWDRRTEELKAQELAGKKPRLNSGKARQRADELENRLKARQEELAKERNLSARLPVAIGGAFIVPIGLLRARREGAQSVVSHDPEARKLIERLAIEKVMEAERALGREPRDVGVPGNPYDIESRDPETGRLLFIEVKGRAADADTVCVTKNEMLTAFNKEDQFVLAIVQVEDGVAQAPKYIRRPFDTEPDFAVTSVNYNIADLLTKAKEPA